MQVQPVKRHRGRIAKMPGAGITNLHADYNPVNPGDNTNLDPAWQCFEKNTEDNRYKAAGRG